MPSCLYYSYYGSFLQYYQALYFATFCPNPVILYVYLSIVWFQKLYCNVTTLVHLETFDQLQKLALEDQRQLIFELLKKADLLLNL